MAACNICKTGHCGCGGQTLCAACRTKLRAIEKNTTLTPEEKQKQIAQLYANHQPT